MRGINLVELVISILDIGFGRYRMSKLKGPSFPSPPENCSSSDSNRVNLINTAVDFLRSPRVSSASDEQKRLFLKSKSLTDEEIDTALSWAADPACEAVQIRPLPSVPASPPVSHLGGGGGRFLMVIIFGGLSYAVYFIYNKYVAPFLRRQRARDEKLAILEESVKALQENVALTVMKVQASVEELESSLKLRDASMVQMEARLNHNQTKLIAEVKQEVTSLKGVMLNVKNFPTPKLPALDSASAWQPQAPSAIIVSTENASPPAWQLQSTSNVKSIASNDDVSPTATNEAVERPETERVGCVDALASPDVALTPPIVISPSPAVTPAVTPPPFAIVAPPSTVEEINYEQIRSQSVPSRSASSSGSSATSFEVIERKEFGSAVAENRRSNDLLIESDEGEESGDGGSDDEVQGEGELEDASGEDGKIRDGETSEEGVREKKDDNSGDDDGETINCDEAETSVLDNDREDDVTREVVEGEVTSTLSEKETDMVRADVSLDAPEEINEMRPGFGV